MRKLGLLLCFLTSSLWAQSRDEARRADLSFVATQVPKLHLNFFFRLSHDDFNQAVTNLDAQVPTLTDAEFYVGMAKLIAMAGDEHTAIYLNDSAAVRAGFQQLPLQFRWLDDGVFVTGTATEYSRALGMQLVRVGESSINDVLTRLASVIPHSNSQWVRYMAQSYLRGQQILQGLNIVPAASTTPLTFRDLAGTEFILNVAPSSGQLVVAPAPDQGPLPEYLQYSTQNYWFTYSAPRRLLYFKYNRCAEDQQTPFAVFAANLLTAFDANPVDTLVFDLRGNTGGDSALLDTLVNGLISRIPVILANANFRVYTVIDKGTFSSGVDDAMQFKAPASTYAALYPNFDPAKVIRIIGEPTGGGPGGFGEVLPFSLPSSRLNGQYSTEYFNVPSYVNPDYDTDGASFGPDVAVPIRSTDFFARHDPVLAAILARFEGTPAPPSGDAIAVNGASFRIEQGLAPGSFASIFGTFPTSVDGVLVNGQAGQVLAAATSQVNLVLPKAVSPGRAAISVRKAGTEVATGQATITSAGPGIFVLQATDPSQPGAVLNQDSSINNKSSAAAQGSVLQIFGTGYGPLDSAGRAPVEVYLGGVPASILFSGPISQFPGLWQINAVVPAGTTGQVSLYVAAGNIASNAVTVWVQ
jgi:uncharacterized protein (TIGR03437 family)